VHQTDGSTDAGATADLRDDEQRKFAIADNERRGQIHAFVQTLQPMMSSGLVSLRKVQVRQYQPDLTEAWTAPSSVVDASRNCSRERRFGC
jgi:hypothetical protein